MQFELTILGCSGAIPAYNRHPTSHFLNYNGHGFLIDCGEATQMQMAKFNIRRAKLDYIFISHLHGDHFFGLMGLISAFNLNYRENPLNIYGPEGLEEIVQTHFKYSKTKLSYPINFHPTQDSKKELILDLPFLTVESFPLKHRIPTTGFLFKEKKGLRKILPEKIQQYNIPVSEIAAIKLGADFNDKNGTIVLNKELTKPPAKPRSYAFCSDTMYNEFLIEIVKEVDLLYHEATFKNEHAVRAKDTFHSTTIEAATIAKKAGVKNLIIGHYSARYEDLNELLQESTNVFPNTQLAEEGKVYFL
jgi:ribonuclease Z